MADLTIPIIGLLGFLGYKLNESPKTPRKKCETRVSVSPYEQPSGNDIYSSNRSREVNQERQKLMNESYKKSLDPKNTNIIPPFFNSYCQIDCPTDPQNTESNNTILAQVQPLSDLQRSKTDNNILNGPMFNNKGYTQNNNLIKEDFADISELSGRPLEKTHHNMVPFFRGEIKQNMSKDPYNSKLERHTGTSTILQAHKTGADKMFKPTVGLKNVYGNPNLTTLINKDRYVESNLKTNLLPTPQVLVQPLPEESVRPMFKSVDELRVKNNPKTSYTEPSKTGKSRVTNRGFTGKVSKNKNDKYYINSPDRYFSGVSENKATYARENYNLSKADKKTDLSSTGLNLNPGKNIDAGLVRLTKNKNINSNFETLILEDKKHTFNNDWIRNAKPEIKKNNYNDKNSYLVTEQERDTTNRMTLLPAGSTSQGNYHAYTDNAKTTHKESNLFSYIGNAKNDVDAPRDYTADYNYTREKQSINNYNYTGIAGEKNKSIIDRNQYDNVDINSNRTAVSGSKYITPAKMENTPLGVSGENVSLRDDSYEFKQQYRTNVSKNYQQIGNSKTIGLNSSISDSNRLVNEYDFSERINPELLDQFKNNPYTQQLDSY
jgi:hypothetical protein